MAVTDLKDDGGAAGGRTGADPLNDRVLSPQRVHEVMQASWYALLVFALWALLERNYSTVSVMAASAATMRLAIFLAQRGRQSLSRWLMLAVISSLLAFQALTSGGLRDEAVSAFPALLMFASIVGTRRHLIVVLAIIVVALIGITIADRTGWLVSEMQPTSVYMCVVLVTIMLLTAFFVGVLSGDLREALARLDQENRRLHESHAQIDRLAHHDALTGLPNRLLARARAEQAIELARRMGHRLALVFVDLDNFKAINDSLGHQAGDRLLCDIATRLTAVVRASDTVCRQGGDEFIIVLPEAGDGQAIAQIARKLVETLAEPVRIDGLELIVTSSLGVAVFPEDGEDFDVLLRNADAAMYRAKEGGRNAYRFYDPAMNGNIVEALHLISGIRGALQNDEFRLHYQPQFDLRTGAIVGAEALIRWRHPDLGAIPPTKFIPVAERSGLINEVGKWVLREACRQARQWEQRGLGPIAVSVNLSPVHFHRDDVERDVVEALEQSGLAPHLLEIEITESLLIVDSTDLREMMQNLRGRGVRFAVDDFGTGYSNLGYLKRFAVERLKIDQSFVRRMNTDRDDTNIVRAVIDVARNLGLQAVAEGVEDGATLQSLVQMGCDFGQGYHWSPALPAEEFEAYVQRYRGAAA